MSVKLFISYSHTDEDYKNELLEHLSPLKREGLIDSWHDREIKAGQEWNNEIDLNLKDSDIILFLISSSFINSDYCHDKEVKSATELHISGKAQLVPIFIRACKWQKLSFSKFQGFPTDARPISSWTDKDEAWLNVVDNIEVIAREISEKKSLKNELPILGDTSKIAFKENFEIWLRDNEVKLSHRLVNEVKLNDIYVVPDFQDYDNYKDKLLNIVSANTVLKNEDNYLIFGDEQIGKTSLLKYYMIELGKNGKPCIYMNCKDINNNFDKTIGQILSSQYKSLRLEDFLAFKGKTILLDDFEKISLNSKNINRLICYLNEYNFRIIIICETNFSYINNDFKFFNDYKQPNLIELGHQKREELIGKWINLGEKESISSDKNIYKKIDLVKSKIDTILKKKVVPARPIYILMILQMFEAHKKLSIELTSYGHCYQQFIYSNFESGNIRKDNYEKHINVLTELSWWIFSMKKNPNINEMDSFIKNYEKSYISINTTSVIDNLIDCSILEHDKINYCFKYPYIYYFFVAKKIAESYTEEGETKESIKELLKNLHKEDFANILIFVTHHTKSRWILEEIQNNLRTQFSSENKTIVKWNGNDLSSLEFIESINSSKIPYLTTSNPIKEADFSKNQLKFIQEFIQEIPDLVIEQREFNEERNKRNKRLDFEERGSLRNEIKENSKINSKYDKNINSDEDALSSNLLSDVNKVFKSIEIAGQIINNRHASLKKESIESLAIEGIDAGLRFLNFFINISHSAKINIIEFIAENMSIDSDLSNSDLMKQAQKTYLHLTFNVLFVTLNKIASSIGSKEAFEVYKGIEKLKDTPVYSLIKLAIDLQFNKDFDIQEITDLNKKFSNNVVCSRLMKQFIIHHIYMYPIDYKEKQQISQLLKIPLEKQLLLEVESKGKLLKVKQHSAKV